MKKKVFKIIITGTILLLASSCAGMKPFFQAGTAPGLKPQGVKGYTVTYPFNHPSSSVFNTGSSDLVTIQKNRKWKVSASLPAKFRCEF